MRFQTIDLHMHSTVSDGTDSPEEILARVREAGIDLFAVTDHDAIECAARIPALRGGDDPCFIAGVEFSCKDEEGKYHILGYGYDPQADAICAAVRFGHENRMKKVRQRLDFLHTQFGFIFPELEIAKLLALKNPGKPHIGNLMVQLGFALSKEDAIQNYIDKAIVKTRYLRPEEAIRSILDSGGIPVLAHPCYGSGDQLILGEELDARLRRQVIGFAEKYGLYVTAGSDYHGKNKLVQLGDTGLAEAEPAEGLLRFLEDVKICGA